MALKIEKQVKFKLTNKELEEFKSLVKGKGLTMQFVLRQLVLSVLATEKRREEERETDKRLEDALTKNQGLKNAN